MIIVSGLHRKTGAVRTQEFEPGLEGPARKFRERLRSLGYNTVLVNEVKERYREAARRGRKPYHCTCSDCANLYSSKEKSFPDENITGYQLHSLGTERGNMKGAHIKECGSDTLAVAIVNAEARVSKWSDGHKGIVIYKAISLVRKITKPTTEIVELS